MSIEGEQRYYDKYDNDNYKNQSCRPCRKCCKKLTKKIIIQIWKLIIFLIIFSLCGFGIYWGSNEIISLNNFKQIKDGCEIISIETPINGTSCNECNCNYYYNALKFERKRICESCSSVKYSYLVKSDKCGNKLLSIDDDYFDDLACGKEIKNIGQKYTCYLYEDCNKSQYSFDTMYADQKELVFPIIVIVVCCILIIFSFLVKCLCC